MEELKEELKNKIITTLNLEDIAIEDIADNDPLFGDGLGCLLYTSPSPRDRQKSRMPSSA